MTALDFNQFLEDIAQINRITMSLCAFDPTKASDDAVLSYFPNPDRFFDGLLTAKDLRKCLKANLLGCVRMIEEYKP